MTARARAPDSTHRLVPSRFPPVAAFDEVTNAGDLAAVMELEGWTNDRLTAARLKRLPPDQWVFDRPNASIVMAAFLHGAPQGGRFNGPYLGAWYAASTLESAMTEVLSGLRREIAQSALTEKVEEYREYTAGLAGDFIDIRKTRPDLHDPDMASYRLTQPFGEAIRAAGGTGIAYDSLRHPGGENWVSYRPDLVLGVTQARHFRTTLRLTGKVIVERLEG